MQLAIDFDGATFDAKRDGSRLFAQLQDVRAAMSDHDWHTLPELHAALGHPEASISARIRDLRKERWGSHMIERKHVGAGLWAYRMST